MGFITDRIRVARIRMFHFLPTTIRQYNLGPVYLNPDIFEIAYFLTQIGCPSNLVPRVSHQRPWERGCCPSTWNQWICSFICSLFMYSLRCNYLTSVSDVCQAWLISLIWAPNGLNIFPEVWFEFAFIVIGKWTMAYLTANHDMYSYPSRQGGLEQEFWCCFTDRLNQSLIVIFGTG